MVLAGMKATGKGSQLLAMILLQNCNLDESTWNLLTIQLVGKAERRIQSELEQPSHISIMHPTLKDIQHQVEELQQKFENT